MISPSMRCRVTSRETHKKESEKERQTVWFEMAKPASVVQMSIKAHVIMLIY